MEQARGRSWGGRRINVQLSNPGKKMESTQPVNRFRQSPPVDPRTSASNLDNPWFNPQRRLMASFGSSQQEGWILQKGESSMVRVAPWVIDIGKRSLTNSLVRFLKHPVQGLPRVFPRLGSRQGKLPDKVKLLDSTAVWMQFGSDMEAEEFLLSIRGEEDSPFQAVKRWMEILGRPQGGVWLRHVWREGVIKLLGDSVSQTLEVDRRTIQQEDPLFGRVKVLRDEMRSLPKEIVLWLDDVQVPVKVEKESIIFQHKSQSDHGWEKMAGSLASSFLISDDGGEDEDQTFEEGLQ